MNEPKNMKSIARRFNRSWFTRLFSIFLFFDILIFGFVFCGWCYFQETADGRAFHYKTERSFKQINENDALYNREELSQRTHYLIGTAEFEKKLKCTKYVYGNQEVYAGKFLIFFNNCVLVVVVLQLIILFFYLLTGTKTARKYLAPLDEMTLKATVLANAATFDESKFQDFEAAISNFSPTSEDAYLSTGDTELQGLEEAVNKLLDRMRASYRQQTRFVSDASHELRTPISVIQGYANMLDRWGKEDERILEESISAIKGESDQMKQLVEQLLFLARGDSGKTKLTMETFSLTNMAREVYNESVMIDPKHHYVLKKSDEIIVKGDLSMMKQAVRILVENAVKYTPEKAEILLWTERNDKGECCFVVQDEGIGIAEEDTSHIFERFFRSDPARNRDNGGTGLGLSIAKWIVDRHGGYFQVLSREEIGTRIKICLPPFHEKTVTETI